MDFSFSEEQEAVRELADRIFTDLSTPSGCASSRPSPTATGSTASSGPSWPRPDSSASPCPRRWAGPVSGFVETGLLVEAAGRTAAYVPIVETLAAAAPAIARSAPRTSAGGGSPAWWRATPC